MTTELNVQSKLTVSGVNITDELNTLNTNLMSKLSLGDIADKQQTLSINNLSISTFQNSIYELGGLNLDNQEGVSVLTYIPPVIRDWTQDQIDYNIDINNIPALPYASQTLASNGLIGLSSYNFSESRKNKLASISGECTSECSVRLECNKW